MTDFAQLFYRMLPGIYRQKDASGQLQQFLQLMADPASELEQSIGQLYLDLYVDSCRPEFLKLIGDLIGAQLDAGDPATVQRATLATQFAFYRSKGLALPLARVVEAISTWTTVTVDYSQVVARLPYVEALDVVARRRAVAVAEDSPSSGRFYFNVVDANRQTITPLYDELRGRPIARGEVVTLASEVVGTDFGFNIYDRGVALIGPKAPAPLTVLPADLTNFASPKTPGGVALVVAANQVAIDPALGRFLIVSPKPLVANVTVDFHQLSTGTTPVQTFDIRDSARMEQLGRSDDPAPYTLDFRSPRAPTDRVGRMFYDNHGFFMTVGSTVANQRPNLLSAAAFSAFSFDSRPLANGDTAGNLLQLQDGIDGAPLTRARLAGKEDLYFDPSRGLTIHDLATSLRDPAYPTAVRLRAANLTDYNHPLDANGAAMTLQPTDVAIDPQTGRFLVNLTAIGLDPTHLRVGYLLAPNARFTGATPAQLGPSVFAFAADGGIAPIRDAYDGTTLQQKINLGAATLAGYNRQPRGFTVRVTRNHADVAGALTPVAVASLDPSSTAAANQLAVAPDQGRFALPAGFLQVGDVVSVDFTAEDRTNTARTFDRVAQRMPRMIPAGITPVLVDTRHTKINPHNLS